MRRSVLTSVALLAVVQLCLGGCSSPASDPKPAQPDSGRASSSTTASPTDPVTTTSGSECPDDDERGLEWNLDGRTLSDRTFARFPRRYGCLTAESARFRDVLFKNFHVAEASFRRASLKDVRFVNSSLLGVRFRGATLSRVTFSRVNLRASDIEFVDLGSVTFRNVTCPSGARSGDLDGWCPEFGERP